MPLYLFYSIGGFPSHFFGWGGEDDALYDRLAKTIVTIERFGKDETSFVDLETRADMDTASEKRLLPRDEWQNATKRQDILRSKGQDLSFASDLMRLDRLVTRRVEKPV